MSGRSHAPHEEKVGFPELEHCSEVAAAWPALHDCPEDMAHHPVEEVHLPTHHADALFYDT